MAQRGDDGPFLERTVENPAAQFEGLAHLVSVSVAELGVLGQSLPDEDLDDRGEIRAAFGQRDRIRVGHLVEDGVHRIGIEGAPASDHLVEHGAEGEDVRGRSSLLAAHLLGGHVVRRPHDRPGARHLGFAESGQTEIHDLDAAVGLDMDVGRLEIAVDDTRGVGVGDPVQDLLHDRQLVFECRKPAALEQILQVLALEQLHGHEDAPGVFAKLVEGDHVRVVEPGGGLSLPQEALAEIGIARARLPTSS